MKKIILILFLFLSCYLIYIKTEKKELSYVAIGDSIANLNYNNQYRNYNNNYINTEYRIVDLINIIKYQEDKTIHRAIKNADILIISVGMNDICYKLNTNITNIYDYLNNMINNLNILFNEIDKYNYKEVFVLGYYNISNKNNDLFTYINYKLKSLTEKYHYSYIELNNILKNNNNYYKKDDNFNLNIYGYNEINKIIVEKLKKY